MAELDISSDAVRTALSRLSRNGLVERSKAGRATAYTLSPHGRELVAESIEQIMSFGEPRSWDGMWTLVAFSVREGDEHLRHQLRSRIRARGFTPVYDGLWCAAGPSMSDARSAIDDAGVDDAVVFRGEVEPAFLSSERFREALKLDDLESRYEAFTETFQPLLDRVRAGQVAPAEALIARTRIMDAWRVFPKLDAELPEDFFNRGRPRSRAREVFLGCYRSLEPTAQVRLAQLVNEFAARA
jgi:phenylacetic acid degradation operon negative regulatory protein